MSNISVFSLDDYLPFYKIARNGSYNLRDGVLNQIATVSSTLNDDISLSMKDSIINDMDADEESDCPDWVNKLIKLGAYGEEVVFNYLSSIGLNVIQTSKTDSSTGYDIKSDAELYEVKTTTNSDLKFFISYNELKVSNINKDNYNIFIVYINSKEKAIQGFIINNPIMALKIDFNLLTQIYETPVISILPNTFRIKIKEVFLNDLKIIDLTNFA